MHAHSTRVHQGRGCVVSIGQEREVYTPRPPDEEVGSDDTLVRQKFFFLRSCNRESRSPQSRIPLREPASGAISDQSSHVPIFSFLNKALCRDALANQVP